MSNKWPSQSTRWTGPTGLTVRLNLGSCFLGEIGSRWIDSRRTILENCNDVGTKTQVSRHKKSCVWTGWCEGCTTSVDETFYHINSTRTHIGVCKTTLCTAHHATTARNITKLGSACSQWTLGLFYGRMNKAVNATLLLIRELLIASTEKVDLLDLKLGHEFPIAIPDSTPIYSRNTFAGRYG